MGGEAPQHSTAQVIRNLSTGERKKTGGGGSVGGPRDEKPLCVFSFHRCCLSCKCSHHGRAGGPNVADTSHLQSLLEMILSAPPPPTSSPPPIPTRRQCLFSSSRGQCGVARTAPPPLPPLSLLLSAFEHLFTRGESVKEANRCDTRRKKEKK